jgi:hypothetical protein
MKTAEKAAHYATAPRVTAARITQIQDGRFVSSWVGKLRGMVVSDINDNYKHPTREAALECARNFRERCRAELPHNA